MVRSRISVLSVWALLCLGLTSCKSTQRSEQNAIFATSRDDYDPYQKKSLNDKGLYEASKWFEDVPLSTSGIPMIMFKTFSDYAPDIWGKDMADLSHLGLPRRPPVFGPDAALPMGMGYHRSPKKIVPLDFTSIQVVGLTCAACHTGRVKLDDGSVRYLLGGASQQFDPNKFGDAVFRTVSRPDFTGARFRELISAKSDFKSWVYNNPAMLPQQELETYIFLKKKDEAGNFVSDAIVQSVKEKVLTRQGAVDDILGALYRGNVPPLHGGTPGQADALGKITVIAKGQPLTAAPVDLPAVWRQDTREYAQFDGSIRDPLFRNLAAEFGVGGVAEEVNVVNAQITTDLVTQLVAPRYPFAIDQVRAKRGEALFAQYCASCHGSTEPGAAPKTVRVPFTIDRGNSTERARQLDSVAIAKVASSLKLACETGLQEDTRTPWIPSSSKKADLKHCNVNPADILFDQTKTPGTVGQALTGIWSTAPYLHNGSVPTLRALLIPSSRPTRFARGNLSYDQINLGYTFESIEADNLTGTIYDSSKLGNSNQGHSTMEMLGRDWGSDPEGTADLLEHLKTL